MLVVAGGLLILTDSFWMSLGIFILLLVFDVVVGDKLQEWIDKRHKIEE
jgi:hypothetical protein